MKKLKIFLLFVFFFTVFQGVTQNTVFDRDSAQRSPKIDIDSLVQVIRKNINQVADYQLFDKALQTRKLGKNRTLVDSMEVYYDGLGIDFMTISNMNNDEFWARAWSSKKAYGVNGKIDTAKLDNQTARQVIMRIKIDSVSSMKDFKIRSTVAFSEPFKTLLSNYQLEGLETEINTYLAININHLKAVNPSEFRVPVQSAMDWMYRKFLTLPEELISKLNQLKKQEETIEESWPHAYPDFQVVFTQSSDPNKTTFGFDQYNETYIAWESNYQHAKTGGNEVYYIPHASNYLNPETATSAGYVLAEFKNNRNPSITLDSLTFKDMDGETFTPDQIEQIDPTHCYIALPNGGRQKDYIVAYHKNHRIGKLKVFHYNYQERRVNIVPVGFGLTNADELTNALNQVYAQSQIKWQLEIKEQFTPESELFARGIEVPKGEGVEQYSDQMRALRREYFETHPEYEKARKQYLIFVVNSFTTSEGSTLEWDGFMPRGRGMGFVTRSAISDGKTLAHELAHGAFGLEHTWHEGGPAQGRTTNLMDYTSGPSNTTLTKAQWDEMNRRLPVLSYRDGSEDAASTSEIGIINYTLLFKDIRTKGSKPWNEHDYQKGHVTRTHKVGEHHIITKWAENDEKIIDFSSYEISNITKTNFDYTFYDDDVDNLASGAFVSIRFKEKGNEEYTVLEIIIGHSDLFEEAEELLGISGLVAESEKVMFDMFSERPSLYMFSDYMTPTYRDKIPAKDRIKGIKGIIDYEDQVLTYFTDLTNKDRITEFHDLLISEKVKGKPLITLIEEEFNDLDFMKDGNLHHLAEELTKQCQIKLGAANYQSILSDKLSDGHVYFWDGVNKAMDKKGNVWNLYSSSLSNGKVNIKIEEWHPNNWELNKSFGWQSYDPLDEWVLIYITKDIEGVSNTKGRFSLVPYFVLHTIIQGEKNAGAVAAIRLGIDAVSMLGGGLALQGLKGVRYAAAMIEIGAAMTDANLILGRDYLINDCGLDRETYEDLMFVTGVAQLSGLGAIKWSSVVANFSLKANKTLSKIEDLIQNGKNLSRDKINNLKLIAEKLRKGLDDVGELKVTDNLVNSGRITPSNVPDINATPRGTRTPIGNKLDDPTKTSLIRENETADILARNGYDIEQNPSVLNTTKKPDYKIEGEVFDCYSPYNSKKGTRGIWTEVKSKIASKQTERVVVNLEKWNGEISNLQKQFTDYPIENLKELIVIDKNKIVSHINL